MQSIKTEETNNDPRKKACCPPEDAPGHFDALEGAEGEQAVDVYEGQDHKRGPAPRPRAIFQSESTQLIEDIESGTN